MGFSRQFTGGFENVANARQFVVHDGGAPQPLDRGGARPASVAGRSLELFDTLALDWDSAPEPGRPGHVVWFELEA